MSEKPGKEGMDPARIARLRDPGRLGKLDPELVWRAVAPVEEGTIVDIGTGVGYLSLPMARRFPEARVIGCDILPGMLALLREAAAAEELGNLETLQMAPAQVPLPDGAAQLITMVQVHHELEDAPALMAECRRLLAPAGTLAIIDWKVGEGGQNPHQAHRVPEETLHAQLETAGFTDIRPHAVYPRHNFLTARR